MDMARNYTDWLYNHITQDEISEGVYEITTPFLDRHNDYTQVYVKYNKDGSVEVNDYGYIINDLMMSGFEFNTPKRRKILKQILNRFGLDTKDDVIYTTIHSINDLAEAKHRLIQGMIYINDMYSLSKSNVRSLFLEEVTEYLDAAGIVYVENVSIIGKSSLTNNFDFILPKNSKNPERVIKLMNNPGNTSSSSNIIFSWLDSYPVRKSDSKLYVYMNDSNKVSSKVVDSFLNYKDEHIYPLYWSKRENYTELLA